MKSKKEELTRMFQELKKGDKVVVKRSLSRAAGFPERIEGKTGTIEEKRGEAYIVGINEGGKKKRFIIRPIHLKKLV